MAANGIRLGTGQQFADIERDFARAQGLSGKAVGAPVLPQPQPGMGEWLASLPGLVVSGIRGALFGDQPGVWDKMRELSAMEAAGRGRTPEARHAMLDIASQFNFAGPVKGEHAPLDFSALGSLYPWPQEPQR